MSGSDEYARGKGSWSSRHRCGNDLNVQTVTASTQAWCSGSSRREPPDVGRR
jgi:hypothetical protein